MGMWEAVLCVTDVKERVFLCVCVFIRDSVYLESVRFCFYVSAESSHDVYAVWSYHSFVFLLFICLHEEKTLRLSAK